MRSKAMKDRCKSTAKKFLESKGIEVLDSDWDETGWNDIASIETDDEKGTRILAFTKVEYETDMSKDYCSPINASGYRAQRENEAFKWLSAHAGEEWNEDNLKVRFDEISLKVAPNGYALLRRHVNCLGYGSKDFGPAQETGNAC